MKLGDRKLSKVKEFIFAAISIILGVSLIPTISKSVAGARPYLGGVSIILPVIVLIFASGILFYTFRTFFK